jgi:hypothetical protein
MHIVLIMISNEQVQFLIHQLNLSADLLAAAQTPEQTSEAKHTMALTWSALVQAAEPGLLNAASNAADWLGRFTEPGARRAGESLRDELNAVRILPDVEEHAS